jgi:alginate O-acetyltransferase complex protein AlgI
MSFVSFTFALFFLVVLAFRVALARCERRAPWVWTLLVTSLVFYAWHVPVYVLLLLAFAAVGHGAARAIAAAPVGSGRRRLALAGAVTFALGTLALFKYADYLAGGASFLLAAAGGSGRGAPVLALTLPLGISFYTFETISYVVDVHRRRIPPAWRCRDVLVFIAFFPHLVAGPIVRAGDFLYQLDRRRRPRLRVMTEGAYLVVRGLFLKVVVADNLASIVDSRWQLAATPGTNASLALLVTVLFAFQILCDFEGYSTIARGTAYLLGFRLPLNFDSPYVAGTFREFWQRWHITLSRWLRDYLYVPLGGNRGGRARTYGNLLVVMTLGGLWHGAANTFVVWGAIHGASLALERALGLHELPARGSLAARVGWWVVVQATVLAAWVVFRSPTLGSATALLGNVVFSGYGPLDASIPLPRLGLALLMPIGGHVRTLLQERYGVPDLGGKEKAVLAAVMLYAVCTAYGPSTAFIYFQF